MAHTRRSVEDPGASLNRPRPSGIQTFSSLASKDFRLLWTGGIFSQMAFWLQILSLGWLVWELTKDPDTGQGSALLSGTVSGLRALPTLVLSPWAGVLLDRVDRRKSVIVVQFILGILAVLFAYLVASGSVEVWHAFVYSAVTGVCYALAMPALQTLIVNTVPPHNLGNAFALNAMTVNIMRITGALLGGLLITTVGIKWNFFVESGAYIGLALLLIPLKTPYQEQSTARSYSVLTNMKDGISYLWRENRIIFHLLVLNLILNLVFIPIPNLLPAYTGEVLGSEADVGGYLMAAQGVAGLTATIFIASLGFTFKKGKVGLIALATGCAAILGLAQSHWLFLSLAMMALMGVSQTNFIVSNQTLVQGMIPDTLRGRITSIYTLMMGVSPIGISLISLFIEMYTASGALTIVSSVGLALSLCFLVSFRQVRQLE
ncbi:MAG: MFS transporter [Dehalococcoidia bacterium]|nr:MFS transporter [Dehalococcoidia bacterium]